MCHNAGQNYHHEDSWEVLWKYGRFHILGRNSLKKNTHTHTQYHIHRREANNRLKSVNGYHCAYQNLLSSCLVPQNIIKPHNSRVSCDVLHEFWNLVTQPMGEKMDWGCMDQTKVKWQDGGENYIMKAL